MPRYQAKAKISSQTYLFFEETKTKTKITQKSSKLISCFLIFQPTPFELQLLPTKAPLPLIMTFLFRDFQDEHLSQL